MGKRDLINQAVVKEILDYNPETGILTWKFREDKWFWGSPGGQDAAWAAKKWNAKFAGKNLSKHRTSIFNVTYRLPHLIWLWMTGRWPNPAIDHKDGNDLNNRWNNLRQATSTINNRNRKRLNTNTTGVTGATLTKDGKFAVYFNRKRVGTYSTAEEANLARKQVELKHGYTERHGK